MSDTDSLGTVEESVDMNCYKKLKTISINSLTNVEVYKI